MLEDSFIVTPTTKKLPSGTVSWQSPSNIALVKYWGKHGEQLPQNASISFTLHNCHTATKLYYCLLYTSPSPRDQRGSRMPSSA